jgi:hypothetical protein
MSKIPIDQLMANIQERKNRLKIADEKNRLYKQYSPEEMANKMAAYFDATGLAPTPENAEKFWQHRFKEIPPPNELVTTWLQAYKKRAEVKRRDKAREEKHRKFRKRVFKTDVIPVEKGE